VIVVGFMGDREMEGTHTSKEDILKLCLIEG